MLPTRAQTRQFNSRPLQNTVELDIYQCHTTMSNVTTRRKS